MAIKQYQVSAILIGAGLWLLLLVSETGGQSDHPVPRITLGKAVMAQSMERLSPRETARTFSPSVGKLYAYTQVLGAREETKIIHLWFYGDRVLAEVKLPVRSVNWRTFSSKKIAPGMRGNWRVDITTADGTLLKSLPFTIQ